MKRFRRARRRRDLASRSALFPSCLPLHWIKMHNKIEHHLDRGLRILDGDRLGRIMADASLATKEKHSDGTELRHGHGVVTCPARKRKDPMPLPRERFRQVQHQAFVAWRRLRLVKRGEAYGKAAL